MRDTEVAPDPQLLESMRAVGYTLETAIADVIDNSITAGGDLIEIRFTAHPVPTIAIIDNGSGMDEPTLIEAMKLAGRPPSLGREPHDLGRFGLGLKTASLSQARSLTVLTKQDSSVRAVRWSLDHLAATGRWSLQILDDDDIDTIPWRESLDPRPTGTLVLWEQLDQLHTLPGQAEGQLDELMGRVREHLSLVFHRFTSAPTPPLSNTLKLRINGADVPSVDPFLTRHRSTQQGPREVISVDGSTVTVQAYTLPHINKLRQTDRAAALIAGSLRDSQGFYIYRASRLVLWGTWFRIIPRDELGKLARVQVDIPNALDHLWALDIKKSSASPPPEVRRRLHQIAGQIVRPSRRVHRYRGRPVDRDRVDRLWTLVEERGTFRYEINREHPLLVSLSGALDDPHRTTLDHLLRAIEATFPVEDAYNRLGTDAAHAPSEIATPELAELARELYATLGESIEIAAQQLALVEPFNALPDLEAFLRGAIDD